MKFRSLTVTLAIAFLAVSIIILLVFNSLDLYYSIRIQRIAIADRQQRIAQEAANTVKGFVQEKFRVLAATAHLTNLANARQENQILVLERLLGLEKAFRHLVLSDAQEREMAKVSRLSELLSLQIKGPALRDLYTQVRQDKPYISPVYIDEVTSEPMVTMAVSVTDVFGDFKGALIAESNLKFMWDVVENIKVGNKGTAYVVDRRGNLIAFGDIGIGIKKDDIDLIFNPFEQVEKSISRRFEGTGLGLSLSKRMVELHDGILWVESEGENKGSTFSFIIPYTETRC